MTMTTLDTKNTAPKTSHYQPEPVTVVVDQPDLAALLAAGLRPSALPCERCGVHQGHHRSSTACPAFVRPQLPAGFLYADQLVVGQEFGFLPAGTSQTCKRRLVAAACCALGNLTILTSTAQGCEPATHWVDGSLVVTTLSQRP